MRVMLDSRAWTDLEESKERLESFRNIYDRGEFDVIFSVGNFLDLIRRGNEEGLPEVICEFSDEYLAPLQLDLEGEYRYSSNPLILATIDAEWYEHCKQSTRNLDELETLTALFRKADFDDGPVFSRIPTFVDEYRQIENRNASQKLRPPEDTMGELELKKVRTFPEYVERRDDGTMTLDDAAIPLKRYILGMSMIYISETQREPGEREYRDAVTWTQAIISGCDLLWTRRQWESEHSLIEQVIERIDREYLDFARNLNEFENMVSG